MDLTLYRDEDGFSALHDEWNDLLRRSRLDTIFLTWEWQTVWWRHLGVARGSLNLLAVREGPRLIGVVPLYLVDEGGQQILQVVGCIEVSDYLDFIIEAGQEQAVYAALLEWLAGPEAPAWDLVDLCNQPMPSLAHTLLPEMVRERGWSATVLDEDVCPVIHLPQAATSAMAEEDVSSAADADALWDMYLASLVKKQRHEIRRKIRRLMREAPDATIRFVDNVSDLTPEVERFIALHRLSGEDKDAFMTDEMQAFFQGVAAASAEQGWLQLSFLEIGGKPVATYFCFDYKNEILVFNSGYDPSASPNLSPGWVLLAHLIQHAIALGRVRFDFLQGDEDYKHRFGGVDEPVYRTLIRRAGTTGHERSASQIAEP